MKLLQRLAGASTGKFVMFAMLAALALIPGFAFAAIDITAASTEFTAVGTAVATLGGLMISAVVAGVAAKWVVAYLI